MSQWIQQTPALRQVLGMQGQSRGPRSSSCIMCWEDRKNYESKFQCKDAYVCVCMCICVYIHVCICMCVCISMCICACVCMYICVLRDAISRQWIDKASLVRNSFTTWTVCSHRGSCLILVQSHSPGRMRCFCPHAEGEMGPEQAVGNAGVLAEAVGVRRPAYYTRGHGEVDT